MEYAPGGELFVRLAEIGSYTESEAKPIFAQIASAIHYMVNLIRLVCYILPYFQAIFLIVSRNAHKIRIM